MLKRKLAMRKLMDVYDQRQGESPQGSNMHRFVFDGSRIEDTATPDGVSGACCMRALRSQILNDIVCAAWDGRR